MSRMMSFKAGDAEETEILDYCKAKHFRSIPDFLRHAVFGYIGKNKPGGHRTSLASKNGNGSGRISAPASTDKPT
jgi:hypothetical protein